MCAASVSLWRKIFIVILAIVTHLILSSLSLSLSLSLYIYIYKERESVRDRRREINGERDGNREMERYKEIDR